MCLTSVRILPVEIAAHPIDTIVSRTDIKSEKNKRNYRKQKDHIKLMSYIRDEINGNKDWRNTEGRPTAEKTVREWQEMHPKGKKADCIRVSETP